jgi:hypothetical protein
VDNPFSWDYLTANNIPIWGPFSIFYVVLFTFILAGSAYLYWDATRRFADHKLKRDTVRRGTTWYMWIAGFALFFFVIRYLDFPILTFEKRIWMYLTFAVFLAFTAYVVYFLRSVYPAQLAAFDRSRERRRWTSQAGVKRSTARRRTAR